MSGSPRVAVLDACVLYPAPIRDLLLSLAAEELYLPKWTELIHDEWTRNLLLNRPELTASQLQKTREAMQGAFPTADVTHFEPWLEGVVLPDPADCHVLATAIQCQAIVVVTANLKDFPAAALAPYDLVAQHPDEFICELLGEFHTRALQAFRIQVSRLRNPPKTEQQILDNLRKVGLPTSTDRLLALLQASASLAWD